MKNTIFALLILLAFSCKEKEEPEPDNRTSAVLKVIYKSEDPTGMNVWLTTDDQFYFNTHKDTSEFVFTQTIKNKQNIQGSVSSPNGYWKTLIVIFNSDTLYNQKKSATNSFNIDI
jgi:hypothetical protein